MREIRFRLIKDKKIVGYEWHRTSPLFDDSHIEIYHSKDGVEWHNIKVANWYFILHDDKDQFTGLHDKNGKEIWEENIFGFAYMGEEQKKRMVVKFDDGQFVLYDKYNYPHWILNNWNKDGEVIGSTHENPELLEGT